MNKMIEELYDAIYSPKISPEQLINNATLPNYISVHVEANQIGMVVESKCKLNDLIIATYTYQFDSSKKLLNLTGQIGNQKEELYNRQQEIKSKYDKIKKLMNVYTRVG